MKLSVLTYYKDILFAWQNAIQEKRFLVKIILAPIVFFIYSKITQDAGTYIEARKGIVVNDWILSLFPAHDFSIYVFLLLYTCLFSVIILHLHKPKIVFKVIEMHFWVAVVRQLCILAFPLEAPHGIIVLRDVFLENTVYPHQTPMTKDLFFSGHVASIWIYFLVTENKKIKYVYFLATLLMSYFILSMKVHYSFDIYGALFFTTLIFWVMKKWSK